jgi:Family of unknown function (DUF6191)
MAVVLFMTIPGLVIGLIAFATVDRMGLWANRRFRLPWRKEGLSAPGIDEMHAILYASKRHELDQRRTSMMLPDDERADGSRVDLDGGTAVIRRDPPTMGDA